MKHKINVSVVYGDANVATATVSSNICEEETFKIDNNISSDRRFCSFKDVEDRILGEFKAYGIEFPRNMVDISYESDGSSCSDMNDIAGADSTYTSMCFDVPADEYNSFKRRNYLFAAEKDNNHNNYNKVEQ